MTKKLPKPGDNHRAAFTSPNHHTEGPPPDTHPSWGTVQFSRQQVSGAGAKLFGAATPSHTTIALTVYKASRSHDLHRDWIHGGSQPLVEVELSPVQFAELLTSMNVGGGVPCTVRYVTPDGAGQIPDAPDNHDVQARVLSDFRDDVGSWADKLSVMSTTINDILAKPNITQADRKRISHEMQQMIQHVVSNTGFTLQQFEAATDKTVASAKAEIDAFITGAVQRLGFEKLDEMKVALAGGGAASALPGLTAGRAGLYAVGTEVHVADPLDQQRWEDSARLRRRPGAVGVTTGNIDTRGDDTIAIYEVKHTDGTIAWYDHEELTPIKA